MTTEPADRQQTSRRPEGAGIRTALSDRRFRSWAEAAAIFVLGFVVLHLLYARSVAVPGAEIGLPGHDSFYHVAMASLLPKLGAMKEFPWLEFTWFRDQGDAFVSHHWGFHLLLVPFVKLAELLADDPMAGGRWAMASVFGANLVLFHLLLRQRRVPLHWLWIALFFLLPDQFYMRQGFVRAIGPSLFFLLLTLLALFARRIVLAAIVVGSYVHLYLGAVLFGPLIVAVYAFSQAIGPAGDRVLPWRMALVAALGWAIGVLTYPYAGGMFEFLRLQIFGTGLSPDIEVGREWKPYSDAWFLVSMSAPLLGVWFAAVVARLRMGPRLSAEETTLVILQFLFLLLTAKARRFIEYWPPLCLLSAAYLAAPPLAMFVQWVQSSLATGRAAVLWTPLARRAAALVGVGLLLPAATVAIGGDALSSAARQLRCYYDLEEVRSMMGFLEAHSEPGEIVFTDDWDVFPLFFYHNRHNHYIVGLDPKFTHEREPDLWNRYVKISRGQVPSTIRPAGSDGDAELLPVSLEDIREHFRARWVITDRDHGALADALAAAPELAELVYPSTDYEVARKSTYVVFRIREASESASGSLAAADGIPDLHLGDLGPVSVWQGWGELRMDRSVDGNAIALDGLRYARGLGTHAPSRILYEIPPGYDRFEAVVGVDDETNGRGTIVATVRLDGRVVYESPTLHGEGPPATVRIPLVGAGQIQLEAAPTEDGQAFDHVSWAEARFVAAAENSDERPLAEPTHAGFDD